MYPYRGQPHPGVETAWQAKQASRVRPGGGRTCVRASYIKHDRQALQRLGTTALARRILENPRSRNRREGLRRAVRGYLELDARPTQPQLSSALRLQLSPHLWPRRCEVTEAEHERNYRIRPACPLNGNRLFGTGKTIQHAFIRIASAVRASTKMSFSTTSTINLRSAVQY